MKAFGEPEKEAKRIPRRSNDRFGFIVRFESNLYAGLYFALLYSIFLPVGFRQPQFFIRETHRHAGNFIIVLTEHYFICSSLCRGCDCFLDAKVSNSLKIHSTYGVLL